jgi:two-component system aerobic respiration control sensor histidine kinase ArcB
MENTLCMVNVVYDKHQEILRLKKIISEQQKKIDNLSQKLNNHPGNIYWKILSELPSSVYWKDINGTYLWQNNWAVIQSEREGIPLGYAIGKKDDDIFSKALADTFKENDLLVMQTQKTWIFEERGTSTDGKEIYKLSTKNVLLDDNKNVIGIIGNSFDVTYLKNLEINAQISKEKARIANLSKIEMIRHLEHDIRTPFSGILTLSEIMADTEQDAAKKENLNHIHASAQQLLDYCNKIFDFVRNDTIEIPLKNANFSIRNLINNIYNIEYVAAKSKNLQFIINIHDDVPYIMNGDHARIQKIFLNLVGNAIKFTSTGHVKIIAEKINDYLKLTIEDSGPGMSKETIQMVEKKLSGKDQYNHSGFGLSAIGKLTREVGGSITFESALGQGSKFFLYLNL